METNLEVLNKISAKLGGSADATSVTESLNNIANALGDTNPDVIKSVSDSLNDILEYAGGGGGGSIPTIELTISNQKEDQMDSFSFNGSTYDYGTIPLGQSKTIRDLYLVVEGYGTFPAIYNTITWFSASNLVNCILDGGVIHITDPTKNASATVVLKTQE